MSNLPVASKEQIDVISAVVAGNNVQLDSVAGSGKTTTSLLLASALTSKRVILITYNARLKEETRNRVKLNKLKNLEVHSYHSLGLAYYHDSCFTDSELLFILKNNTGPRRPLAADLIIIDEAQDMTHLYFDFIQKFLRDVNSPHQLVVMGDRLQCIYDFPQKGADSRFLTHADSIYKSSTAPWINLELKTSYRITKQMEWFVNDVMLGYPRMKSVKTSKQPIRYIQGDPFRSVPEFICSEIQKILTAGYKPDDIFILSPSLRSRNEEYSPPIKILENMLVKKGVPCYAPSSDDEELIDEVLSGKVVFSSIHQSKGLERKCVFVAGFNEAFYLSFRDSSREVCPNLLYVASTRSKELLYLWGEYPLAREIIARKPLPFLRKELMIESDYFKILKSYTINEDVQSSSSPSTSPREDKGITKSVTDLTRFLPEKLINLVLELCKVKTVTTPFADIKMPPIIEAENGTIEAVSDLNGIAIPSIYEKHLCDTVSIHIELNEVYLPLLKKGTGANETHKKWISTIEKDPETIDDYLRLSNIYSSYRSGFIFKLEQIKNYGWLTQDVVEPLLAILEKTIGTENLLFEYELRLCEFKWGSVSNINVTGRTDVLSRDVLWELKCVDSLKSEHIIQLALYAWIWRLTRSEHRRFCLHNIRTGEVLEITGVENLEHIAGIILDNNFRKAHLTADEEFIRKCLVGESEYPTGDCSGCLIMDD